MAEEQCDDRLIAKYNPTGIQLFSVVWSPDGRSLAVGSEDKTIRVLDAETGSETLRLKSRNQEPFLGSIFCVSFSPDGRYIASGSNDNTVRIWDVRYGTEIQQFESHTDAVWSLQFNSDKRLASGSADGTVRIWDVESARQTILQGHTKQVRSVSFSPDGRWLASGSVDNNIRIWDALSGIEKHKLKSHNGAVWAVSFSPDNLIVASGSSDKTIRLWDAETGKEELQLRGHRNWVHSLCFSPVGKCLASSARDGTIRIWDTVTGEESHRIENLGDFIWCMSFSPDGYRLASASKKGTLSIWDMTGLVEPLAQPQTPASPLAQWLTRQAASLGRRAFQTVETNPDYWVPTNIEGGDGKGCLGLLKMDCNIRSAELSHDGNLFYSSDREGKLYCWDLSTGNLLWYAYGPDPHLEILKTTSDGARLVAEYLHSICIRNPITGFELSWLEGYTGNTNCMAISPDGTCLATGSSDKTIYLWDTITGSELLRLVGHTHPITCLLFSPEGDRIVSGSIDTTIRYWDSKTGNELARLTKHKHEINHLTFSPGGDRLASCEYLGNTIRLWDGVTGGELGQIRGHKSRISSLAFSPDGNIIVSGSWNGTIRFWNLTSSAEITRLKAGSNIIKSLFFSPAGGRLCSVDQHGTICLWNSFTGAKLRSYTHQDIVNPQIFWAPNGAFLISGGFGDDNIRIWDTRTPEMLQAQSRPSSAVSPAKNPEKRKAPPPELVPLPPAWTTLHRLSIGLPLSLLRDLRALIGAEPSESFAPLAARPGIRRLTALRWPTPAGTGLIALLLHGWDGGEQWRPPPGTDTRTLREALTDALSGEPCDPDAPPPPLGFLTQAADAVDDRMVTLLTALGPKAVAADPGLPLRLRGQAAKLPALAQPQRRLLSLRVIPLNAGAAQGTGVGIDRSGFARSGPVTALVPSQLALPDDLLLWRYLNGGLLYRARSGQEPPQLRPVVIVLDTSPAALGPIGGLTRPAALALSAALGRKRVPSVFLSAGDEKVFLLERPADRLRLLTHRHRNLGDPLATLRRAEALLDGLRDGRPVEPIILLLTHSHWGAEFENAPSFRRLRALFVHYPGSSPRPPWADRCERWEALRHTDADRVPAALGRLIG